MPIGNLLMDDREVQVVYLLNDPELSTENRQFVGVSCLDRDIDQFQRFCKTGQEYVLQLSDGTQVKIQIATIWEERPHPSFRASILGDPPPLGE